MIAQAAIKDIPERERKEREAAQPIAEKNAEAEQFVQLLQDRVRSAKEQISLFRKRAKERHKTELKNANDEQKRRNQRDAAMHAALRGKREFEATAARLAATIIRQSPNVSKVEVMGSRAGMFFLDVYDYDMGELLPWKTYLGYAHGVQQLSLGNDEDARGTMFMMHIYSISLTRQDLQKLEGRALQAGPKAEGKGPLSDLRSRQREELANLASAMKLVRVAENLARQAAKAVENEAGNPDPLMNEMAKWNQKVSEKIDQALLVVEAEKNAQQAKRKNDVELIGYYVIKRDQGRRGLSSFRGFGILMRCRSQLLEASQIHWIHENGQRVPAARIRKLKTELSDRGLAKDRSLELDDRSPTVVTIAVEWDVPSDRIGYPKEIQLGDDIPVLVPDNRLDSPREPRASFRE